MRMGGHSAMPISAQTPTARKNGRKPRLRIAAPRQARDLAAEARGKRWEPATETDARVEMILTGEARSLNEAAVCAHDGAEDRDDPGPRQSSMGARNPEENGRGILRRHRGDVTIRERFDHEDEQHELRPEQDHGVHPPRRRLGEQAPEIEPPRHPEPGRAGQGIENRTCAAKRLSIASNIAQPFPAPAYDRASGSAKSVTKAMPPIQWATNTTCSARATSTSSITGLAGSQVLSVEPFVSKRTALSLTKVKATGRTIPGQTIRYQCSATMGCAGPDVSWPGVFRREAYMRVPAVDEDGCLVDLAEWTEEWARETALARFAYPRALGRNPFHAAFYDEQVPPTHGSSCGN
jgi:hypothetical protein